MPENPEYLPVFGIRRRLSDGTLFDLLSDLAVAGSRSSATAGIALRNQQSGRIHWVSVAGLDQKYEEISQV